MLCDLRYSFVAQIPSTCHAHASVFGYWLASSFEDGVGRLEVTLSTALAVIEHATMADSPAGVESQRVPPIAPGMASGLGGGGEDRCWIRGPVK